MLLKAITKLSVVNDGDKTKKSKLKLDPGFGPGTSRKTTATFGNKIDKSIIIAIFEFNN